jgi:hypothetical protein
MHRNRYRSDGNCDRIRQNVHKHLTELTREPWNGGQVPILLQDLNFRVMLVRFEPIFQNQ